MKFGVSIRNAPETFSQAALISPNVDFVEIAGEDYAFRCDLPSRRQLGRILESKPVAVHGYSLSLLDPAPWSEKRTNCYFNFVRSHPFINLSDHYAITSFRGRQFASLTPAPDGVEAVQLLRQRLRYIQAELPGIPFLIENVAAPFRISGRSLESMVSQLVPGLAETSAGLLLDLSNLAANEANFGVSADDELDRLLACRVGEVHLAGGHFERGFFRDSHSEKVSSRTWQLLKRVAPTLPAECLILIEREQNHPSWNEMEEELNHARRICGL